MKNMKESISRDEDFARRMRTIMGNRNLTLSDIAEATGKAVSTVSTWKRGRKPRAKAAIALARVLNVDLDYLMHGKVDVRSPVFSNENTSFNFHRARKATPNEVELEISVFMERLIKKESQKRGGLEKLFEKLKQLFCEV